MERRGSLAFVIVVMASVSVLLCVNSVTVCARVCMCVCGRKEIDAMKPSEAKTSLHRCIPLREGCTWTGEPAVGTGAGVRCGATACRPASHGFSPNLPILLTHPLVDSFFFFLRQTWWCRQLVVKDRRASRSNARHISSREFGVTMLPKASTHGLDASDKLKRSHSRIFFSEKEMVSKDYLDTSCGNLCGTE